MIRSVLLAIFANAITTKKYDKQIFIKKGDRVNLNLKELFDPHHKEPKPGVPFSPLSYRVEGNVGRMTGSNEVYAGRLAESTTNCYGAKTYYERVVVNCGHLDYYVVDPLGPDMRYSSSFKRKGLKALDFDWQNTFDSLGVVSRQENGRVRFDLIRVGEVKIVNGTSQIGEKAKIVSFLNSPSFIYVAYEKTLLTDKLSGSNVLHYIDFLDGTANTMTLTKAEGFLDDVQYLLDIQTTYMGAMYFSYLSPGTRIPSLVRCQADTSTREPPFLNFTKCMKYNTTENFNSEGTFAVDTRLNGYEKVHFYNKETNHMKLCILGTYPHDNPKLYNCQSTVKPIQLPERRVFESIVMAPFQGIILNFVDKELLGQSGPRDMTVVFNLTSESGKPLIFDQVSLNGVAALGGMNDTLFVLRNNHYSTYQMVPDKFGLILTSEDFPKGYGVISIEKYDHENPKRYRKVSVKVLNDIHSFSSLNPIPKIQNFIDKNTRQLLPISRYSFNGNNPVFKFSQPDLFDQLYLNNLQINKEDLGSQIWFISPTEGVSLKDGVLASFDCHGHIGIASLTCQRSQYNSIKLQTDHKIIYASSNDFPQEEGMILASSKKKTVSFYYFGIQQEEVYRKTIQTEQQVKEGDIWFKITGKLYTFWIIQQNQIALYTAYNKELTAMPIYPSTYIKSSSIKGNTNFCPKSILNCPRHPTNVHVFSNCNGDARIFNFNTSNPDQMKFTHQNPISSIIAPSKQIQACAIGPETIVLDQGKGILFSKDSDGEYSYSEISTQEAGFKTVSSLFCVRNQQAVVISGKGLKGENLVSVIHGNMHLDSRNRFHSTFKVDGDVTRVNQAGSQGLIVTTSGGNGESFYRAYLSGPFIFYQAVNRTSNRFTFSLMNGKEEIDSQDLFLMDQKFEQNITIERTNTRNATTGIYEFFSLATVAGPIFNIDIQDSPEVLLTPRLLQDQQYLGANQSALNLHEPDFIIHSGKYGVGFRTFSVSTLVYFYRNYDQFWFKQDMGVLCSAVSVTIVRNDYAIAAMSTDEGGEYHLRWFIKSFSQGSSRGMIHKDIKVEKVEIVQIDPTHFAVLALSKKTSHTSIYILKVSNGEDGNYWVSQKNQTSTIPNVSILASFNKDYNAIVAYTSNMDNKMHFVTIQSNLELTYLTPISLPQNLQIRAIKCKTGDSKPSCIIINNGNVMTDISLDFQGLSQTLKMTSLRAYFNYQDFSPTEFDFNDELLVVKSSNGRSELMLVYQRSQEGDNNIWWGLTIDEYYNIKGTNRTRSLPLVFRNKQGRTVIRFTQNQMQSLQDQPSPVFKGFKPETSLLILTNNMTQSNAQEVSVQFNQFGGENQSVPISQFLDGSNEPHPNKKGSSWEFWVVVVVVFILAGLVSYFIITKFKGENDIKSRGDDYHYGYTPTENLTVTKYDFDADEVNLGTKLSDYERESRGNDRSQTDQLELKSPSKKNGGSRLEPQNIQDQDIEVSSD